MPISLVSTLAILLPALSASAAEAPTTMTRVTVVWTAANVPHIPAAELPKTMTRAANAYCRFDMPKIGNAQQLGVTAEPLMWQIDLVSMSGKVYHDPGPTYNCHQPIFGVDTAYGEDIFNLEFGRELEYFRTRHAQEVAPDRLQLNPDGRVATLILKADHKTPDAIVLAYGKKAQRIDYQEWRTLPFKADLFAPPKGVTIIEGRIPGLTVTEWLKAWRSYIVYRLGGSVPPGTLKRID